MKILIASDGAPSAVSAVRLVAGLPLLSGTQIQVVCVMDAFVEGLLRRALCSLLIVR